MRPERPGLIASPFGASGERLGLSVDHISPASHPRHDVAALASRLSMIVKDLVLPAGSVAYFGVVTGRSCGTRSRGAISIGTYHPVLDIRPAARVAAETGFHDRERFWALFVPNCSRS